MSDLRCGTCQALGTAMDSAIHDVHCEHNDPYAEISALKAQLAERDALLAEIREFIKDTKNDEYLGAELRRTLSIWPHQPDAGFIPKSPWTPCIGEGCNDPSHKENSTPPDAVPDQGKI